MPNNCTVCMNNSRNTRNISYFCFPRNVVKRNKWLSNIGRYDLIERIGHLKLSPHHYKVCEEHFEPSCFTHNFRLDPKDTSPTSKYIPVKYLSSDAVPTLNLRKTKGIVKTSLEPCSLKQINCSYYGCENSSETFAMFRFPAKKSNRAIVDIWLQNAGNEDLFRLSSSKLRNRYLCEAHFDESFIIESGPGSLGLTKDAVPVKTLMLIKPTKVYSKRMKSGDGSDEGSSVVKIEYDGSDRCSDGCRSSDEDEEPYNKRLKTKPETTHVQFNDASDCMNSEEIKVEVKMEHSEDERQFRPFLCIEVPPLIHSSNMDVRIKTEPDDD